MKDLAARDGSLPSRGKYGLISLSDDLNEENVLVGPSYYAQSRLSEKEINSDSKYEIDRDEADEENSRRPDTDEDREDSKDNFDKNEGDRQVEPFDNSENPFGFEFGKQPVFQPTYEGFYNYLPNPYLPPYNYNHALPIINQYSQRRNAGYPQFALQNQGFYGSRPQQQFKANSPSYYPYNRFFYVQ